MKKTGAFFLFILICISCSYNKDLDTTESKLQAIKSLQKKSRKAKKDSILYYIDKADKIFNKNPKINDSLLLENLFLKGNYYKKQNNLDSARHYFHKTISLVKKPNSSSRTIFFFRSAWEMENLKGNITNAISIARNFIEISDKEKFKKDLIYAYNYLARKNLIFGKYQEALQFNNKILKIADEINNVDMYVITAIAKSRILSYYLKEKEKAVTLLDSLSKIDCSIDSKRQIYRRYGVLNFYNNDFTKAISYYKKVIQLTKEQGVLSKSFERKIDFNNNLIEAYNNISEAFLKIKKNDIATKYLDSVKPLLDVNTKKVHIISYMKYRFLIHNRTLKNEDDILKEYLSFIKESTKQQEEKINEKLYALELANEKEKIAIQEKNKTIIDNVKLESRNIKLIALSSVALLLLVTGYLFYRQRNYAYERQEMQIQQRLLRSQMNSHFSFNTLSVIQNQFYGDQNIAVSYLGKFSRLLRLLLTNSLQNYVLIEDELDLLKRYIELQLFRFPDSFEFNIALENFEEDDILYIPPMLIQPFIENSIEHGFSTINYKGCIHIRLKLLEKYIECVIEDNGAGLQKQRVEGKEKESVSTDLISNFIYKTTKQKIIILDKKKRNKEENGVYVKFLIPYKLTNND
ncbi:tetratricopeptide repeat-containing sensor histidine kinase [Tenacibaculum jejuense]|uniref:Two-component system sensor histidine kinase n=1 Tax=Tenacibaculum jejuense TaxID=584609 RepID=A0A238U8X6_9FLAO|nr:histidine kinase [Tenacibaculum jejuense]SNR15552.1 Two-component system sensor histidine kinase [Tenacibaculum jejuense]